MYNIRCVRMEAASSFRLLSTLPGSLVRDKAYGIHSGTEVVLVREGPRAGGGSSQRKKGSDYFTSPVKTMTLRDIK